MARNHRRDRRRARLRYEDTVAWLLVPVFLIVLTYGALELGKQLAGTPVGKMLGLQ
jgi:hypothetical protein